MGMFVHVHCYECLDDVEGGVDLVQGDKIKYFCCRDCKEKYLERNPQWRETNG